MPPADVRYGADAPQVPRRGIRAKVCAVDWNGDGRPDLLLGDYTTQKADRPEPTTDEKAEQEKNRKELESLQGRFRELYPKVYGPAKVQDKEEREKLQKEFKELNDRMRVLRGKLPAEYESQGWVWLFLRKLAEAAARE